MGDHGIPREFGWTESSGSDISVDPFADDSDLLSQSNEDDEAPFARHGPIIEADPNDVNMQREFWSHCAMGFILDYRLFSVHYLQQVRLDPWLPMLVGFMLKLDDGTRTWFQCKDRLHFDFGGSSLGLSTGGSHSMGQNHIRVQPFIAQALTVSLDTGLDNITSLGPNALGPIQAPHSPTSATSDLVILSSLHCGEGLEGN
ncbi:hypothetical protein CMV_007251 [Castanea mollissima]|nr:hypothetical protein CMV_007251 [Castanea mollissima]